MEQRISLITLGVRDLARARAFYEALGWTAGAEVEDEVVFFQAGGMVMALWGRDKLAEDSEVEDSGGWGGITPAHNVRSPAEGDEIVEQARAAGGTIAPEPAERARGGYNGVVVGTQGHARGNAPKPTRAIAPG